MATAKARPKPSEIWSRKRSEGLVKAIDNNPALAVQLHALEIDDCFTVWSRTIEAQPYFSGDNIEHNVRVITSWIGQNIRVEDRASASAFELALANTRDQLKADATWAPIEEIYKNLYDSLSVAQLKALVSASDASTLSPAQMKLLSKVGGILTFCEIHEGRR